jgi:hypothetical protein
MPPHPNPYQENMNIRPDWSFGLTGRAQTKENGWRDEGRPLPRLRAPNLKLEQGFHGGVLKSPWGEARNRVMFVEEKKTKDGIVLERERGTSFFIVQSYLSDRCENWHDQSAQTDRKTVQKWIISSLGNI